MSGYLCKVVPFSQCNIGAPLKESLIAQRAAQSPKLLLTNKAEMRSIFIAILVLVAFLDLNFSYPLVKASYEIIGPRFLKPDPRQPHDEAEQAAETKSL